MSNWTDIRDAKAAAALAAFREIGVRIDLAHGGGTISGLIADFIKEDERVGEQGNTERRIFWLPRQTNFSGAIDPGDVITSPSGTSTKFIVSEVESDEHEAIYRIVATTSDASGSAATAGFQLLSAAFEVTPPGGGSTTNVNLGKPAGARLNELVKFLEIRAGTLNGPAAQVPLAQGVEIEIDTLELDDNIAAGAKGTLTLTVKESGGGTATIALTRMKRGTVKRDLGRAPHIRTIQFVHEGAMSSSPLSVTV